jgi:DNA-binding response OmpR family regulator
MAEKKNWILIVEDDQDIASSLGERLNHEGIQAVFANTAIEAINKLNFQKFNCIILDLKLKVGRGEDLVETLHSDPDFNSIPIIVISGNIDYHAVSHLKGKISGAFVKPFQPIQLLNKVKELLLPKSSKDEPLI